MTSEKKNTIGYWFGIIGTCVSILVIAFNSGVFVSTTKIANKEVGVLQVEVASSQDSISFLKIAFKAVSKKVDTIEKNVNDIKGVLKVVAIYLKPDSINHKPIIWNETKVK